MTFEKIRSIDSISIVNPQQSAKFTKIELESFSSSATAWARGLIIKSSSNSMYHRAQAKGFIK